MKLKDKMNPKYTQISVYVIVTAAIVYCLSLAANNLMEILGVLGRVLGWLFDVLKPVVLAFAMAYLLTPIVDFFQDKFEHGGLFRIKWLAGKRSQRGQREKKSKRGLAVLTTMLLIVFVLVLVISLLISSITKQVQFAGVDELVELLNGYAANLTDFYNGVMKTLQELNIESETLQEYLQSVGGYAAGLIQKFGLGLVNSLTNISGVVTTFLFTLVIGIYFLIDGQMLMAYWNRVLRALFSERWNQHFHQFAKDADTVFSGYIRGQLMDAFVMMVLISIVLSVVGVKFAVVIGIFAGIGNLIPYVGPFVAYVSTALVCLLDSDWKKLVVAIILLLIVQTIDGNLIGPRLLSSSIHIHPLLVVVSLFFGSAIGGLLGMLLAVPVGALIKVLFNRMIDLNLKRRGIAEHAPGDPGGGKPPRNVR